MLPQHFFGISIPVFAVIAIYGFYEIDKLKINIRYKLISVWVFINVCYLGWLIYHLP